MTPEQRKALALAAARRRRAEAEGGAGQQPAAQAPATYDNAESDGYRGSAVDRFARGTGSGIADILGAPADLMNAGLEKIGLGTDRPWLGSDNIRRGLAVMGSAPQEGVDQAADETLAGQLGSGLGNGIGLLAPWLGAGRAATQARAAATLADGSEAATGSRVLANMVKEAGQRPGLLAASELGGNTGAAAGQAAAERNDLEDGSIGSTLAQIGGGAAGAVAPAGLAKAGSAALDLSQISLLRRVPEALIERARVARGGAYSGRTLDKAGATLQGQASDLKSARLNLANADADPALSPALRTDDRGLMAVENRVASRSPAAQEAQRQAQDAVTGRATESIAGVGGNTPLARTAEELQRRQAGVRQQAQSRVERTQQQARQAADDLGPVQPRADVSRSFDANLRQASREAQDQANAIWSRVDKDAPASVDNLMRGIRDSIDEAGSLDTLFPNGSVPGPLRRLLQQGEDLQQQGPISTNIGELQNLRRILGERASSMSQGANPDRNGSRVMSNLVRAIDDDMASAPGSGVQDAISATRQQSDRFRRDGIARSLARSGTGGEQIQPEQTLERILPLGSQGSSTAGAAGARQIYNAIGTRSGAQSIDRAMQQELSGATGVQLPPSSNAKAIQNDVESYLSGEFMRRAAPDGQLTAQGARKFLRDNQSTLDLPQFSDLRTRLRTAADMQARGEGSEARMAALMDRMNDPSQSRAAMFMGRDTADGTYQNAIRNVTQGNAGDNMRQLVRQVRKDQTGEALNGLKSGYTRHLLERVRGSDGLPDAARLDRIFGDSTPRDMPGEDAALQRAARELFNQTDRRRIRQAADSIRRVQQAREAGSTDADLTGGGVDRLTQIMAQLAGANVGAAFGQGGGSIQTANIGSKLFRDMTGKLLASPVEQAISDAVKDPQLFRALLERSPNSSNIPSFSDATGRTFGSWLLQLPMYNSEQQPELDSAAEDLQEYR